jgi:hypothetical protein
MIQLNTKVGEYEITLILTKEEHHSIIEQRVMNFSFKGSAAAQSANFGCNVWNFIHMFFLFIFISASL